MIKELIMVDYNIIREFKAMFETNEPLPYSIKYHIDVKDKKKVQASLLGYMLVHPESRNEIFSKTSDFSFWDTNFIEIVKYVQKLGSKVGQRKIFEFQMNKHKLLTPVIEYTFNSCWFYRNIDKSVIDNILKEITTIGEESEHSQ